VEKPKITEEEAKKSTLEYFKGNELAAKSFLDKYALRDVEGNLEELTPDDMHRRMARELARIEKNKFKNPLTEDEIYNYLKNFDRIIPQGSVMYGLGNKHLFLTLSNCFGVASPVDSYGGILKTDEELVQICKRRGGVGTDIGNLRPKGSTTHNSSRTSTGIVPFMERFSNTIREVGQDGRRGALMLSCSVHHPQIKDFILSKLDLKKITGANISVKLTDKFLNAVKNKHNYTLQWPLDSEKPQQAQSQNAKEVWNLIISGAHKSAEPGILFWDRIIKESPADCYAKYGFETEVTNPCSEIPLSPYDSCRLLVINLYTYVKNPFTKNAFFDFDGFYEDCRIAQRFADDIIDAEIESVDRIIDKIEKDPEAEDIKYRELELWKKIKEACVNGRRTGTGPTAVGDTLAALGIDYGNDESIRMVSKIYKTMKWGCYRSSVDLAKELGTFPVWKHELEKDNPFLNRIAKEYPELYEDMKKYGRRNIAVLTTAPTGTTSILSQTTSGIEPLFFIESIRRKKIMQSDKSARIDFVDQNGDSWQEFKVYHPKVDVWMKITGETDIKKSPWYGYCAEDLNWKNRIKLQSEAQKHIDHAISSTINLPEDATENDISNIYMEAWESGCKGITVYRKNSRSGVIIEKSSLNRIQKSTAPKRPESMLCDVHHITVKGKKYYVLVSCLEGDPYEVFAGKDTQVTENIEYGIISKVKRGQYQLTYNKEVILDNIVSKLNEDEEALTRMTSTALRHGADIEFVVHQLEKVEGDMMSFARSISRALKHYTNGKLVTGEACPSCGHEPLRRQEGGCPTCPSCGWSQCK
jgi:ribonucleoside-diphosphate reductase alpha chain